MPFKSKLAARCRVPRPLGRALVFAAVSLMVCGTVGQSAGRAAESGSGLSSAYQTLQRLETGNESMQPAQAAAAEIQRQPDATLWQTLTAMKNAGPIGKNWLSAIASLQYSRLQSDAEREKLGTQLVEFIGDRAQDGEARTLAFHWLRDSDPSRAEQLLTTMVDDPSPELRYGAVSAAIHLLPEGDAAADSLRKLLVNARHPDQIRDIIKRLAKLGVTVDQSEHFGFLDQWHLIGPFDNRGSKHFDTVYPVEADLLAGRFDPSKTYVAKDGSQAVWLQHDTDEPEGKVDLAELYNKEKGAVIYGLATFHSDRERSAQVRLTSINANKIWVNGELVMSNNIYHAGTRLDQYIGDVQLQEGPNVIVVKLLQNESTESSAQGYQFHLRITDHTGAAIPESP